MGKVEVYVRTGPVDTAANCAANLRSRVVAPCSATPPASAAAATTGDGGGRDTAPVGAVADCPRQHGLKHHSSSMEGYDPSSQWECDDCRAAIEAGGSMYGCRECPDGGYDICEACYVTAAQQQGQTRADGRGDDDATAEAAIPVAPSPRILERAMEASNGGSRGRAGSNSRGRSTPRAGQPPPKRTQLAGDQSMYGGGWGGQRGGNGGAEEVEQGVANMAVVEEEPPRSRKQQENQAFVSMIEKSRQQQNQRRRERELQDDGGPANGGGGSPSRRTTTTPRGSQHP